jgi:hypothetical protein
MLSWLCCFGLRWHMPHGRGHLFTSWHLGSKEKEIIMGQGSKLPFKGILLVI